MILSFFRSINLYTTVDYFASFLRIFFIAYVTIFQGIMTQVAPEGS